LHLSLCWLKLRPLLQPVLVALLVLAPRAVLLSAALLPARW